MVTLSSVEVHKADAGEGNSWITIFDDENPKFTSCPSDIKKNAGLKESIRPRDLDR